MWEGLRPPPPNVSLPLGGDDVPAFSPLSSCADELSPCPDCLFSSCCLFSAPVPAMFSPNSFALVDDLFCQKLSEADNFISKSCGGKLLSEVASAFNTSQACRLGDKGQSELQAFFFAFFFQIQPNFVNEWVSSVCSRMHALFWSFEPSPSFTGAYFLFSRCMWVIVYRLVRLVGPVS